MLKRFVIGAAMFGMAMAGSAQAATVSDPVGDFLPSFVGAQDADLDVTQFSVFYSSATQRFTVRALLAGNVDPSRPGLYVLGINTGTGVARPFGAIGNPNVIFNQVAVIRKSGVTNIGANPLTAAINANRISLVIPLSLLPSTGFAPTAYGFNLWPRNGLGNSNQITDFAPDNANLAPGIPEPASWAMMLTGFGLSGSLLRRSRRARGVNV